MLLLVVDLSQVDLMVSSHQLHVLHLDERGVVYQLGDRVVLLEELKQLLAGDVPNLVESFGHLKGFYSEDLGIQFLLLDDF